MSQQQRNRSPGIAATCNVALCFGFHTQSQAVLMSAANLPQRMCVSAYIYVNCVVAAVPVGQCSASTGVAQTICTPLLQAAEARARKAALMPAGPQRLGGSSGLYKHMTPAQAAAAAAERRARDNLWCGAEHADEIVEQEVGSVTLNTAPAIAAVIQNHHHQQQQQQQQQKQVPKQQQQQHDHQHQQQHHQQLPPEQRVVPEARAVQSLAALDPVAAAASCAPLSATSHQLQQALQSGWQQHLQRQAGLMAQQQQHLTRKRPAPDSIDLTLSDEDEDSNGDQGAAAAAAKGAAGNAVVAAGAASDTASGPGTSKECPCHAATAAAAAGPGSTAESSRSHHAIKSHNQQHWQQQQQQQQQDGHEQQEHTAISSRAPYVSDGGPGDSGRPALPVLAACLPDVSASWVCQLCTLINRPLALQCEACCSVRDGAVYSNS